MNRRGTAATPSAVKSDPPSDASDLPPVRPWHTREDDDSLGESSLIDETGSENSFGHQHAEGSTEECDTSAPQPLRPTKMVGSIVDPSVLDDDLNLTGPGAPLPSFTDPQTAHPVRARLLQKAEAAKLGIIEFDDSTAQKAEGIHSPSASDTAPPSVASSTPLPPRVPAPSLPPPSRPPSSLAAAPFLPPSSHPLHTPSPAAVADELDRIAGRRTDVQTAPRLSPQQFAVFGGFAGFVVVVSLGLFLSESYSELATAPTSEKTIDAPPPPEPQKEVIKKSEREEVKGPWRIKDDATQPGHRVLSGKIGNKAFLRTIQDAGLPKNQAYRAYAALKDLKNLDHCKSTDKFAALVKGRDKHLVAFEYSVNPEEIYQAKLDPSGRLVGNKLDLKVSRNQIRRSFIHDGRSFEESARRAGFDPGLASIAEVALRGHARLSDIKKGDHLRMIAQEVTVLGNFSRYSGIEAMEILRDGKKARRIYYYSHPLEGGHFDKNGRAPYEGGWRKPISNAPVTSKFNMKRMHPVLNRVMPHTGTDFGAPSGTPIGATSPGVVSFRGKAGASGNLVKIKHEGGYESGYAHLSKFAKIHVGDKVDRMQIIGYCGTTGRSTGPHLHFTMKKNGKFIDAESLSLDGLRVLPKSHRDAFTEVRAKYDPILDQVPLAEAEVIAQTASTTSAQSASPTQSPPVKQAPAGMMPDVPSPSEVAQRAPSSIAPTSPSPTSIAPQPAIAVAPSAIFLTDSELLRMQGASDDGEVNE